MKYNNKEITEEIDWNSGDVPHALKIEFIDEDGYTVTYETDCFSTVREAEKEASRKIEEIVGWL